MAREMLFALSQKVIINVCLEIISVIDRMLFMKVIDTAFLNGRRYISLLEVTELCTSILSIVKCDRMFSHRIRNSKRSFLVEITICLTRRRKIQLGF